MNAYRDARGGRRRKSIAVDVPGTTGRLAYLPGAAFTLGSHSVAVQATLANGTALQVPGASVSVVESPRNNAVTFAYGISGSLVTVEAALDSGGWTSIFPSCPASGADGALPPGYLAAHTFSSLQPNTTHSASLRVVTTVGVSAPLTFTFTTPPYGGSPNLGVVGSLTSPVP